MVQRLPVLCFVVYSVITNLINIGLNPTVRWSPVQWSWKRFWSKPWFLLVCSFVVVVVAVVVAVEVTERYDCIFLDFVTLIKFFLKLKIYRRPSGLFGTKIQQQHKRQLSCSLICFLVTNVRFMKVLTRSSIHPNLGSSLILLSYVCKRYIPGITMKKRISN